MKREVSCLNTKALVDYVRAKNPERVHLLWEPLRGKLPRGEDPELYLTDANNWISAEICRDIMEQTKKATEDEMAVYNAGFESVTQRKFGCLQRIFIRALFTPKHVVRKLQKINDRANQTKKVEVVLSSNTHAVLRLHWFKELPLSRDFCLLNRGIYEAMSTIWDLPPARLQEHVCFFQGGPCCEYEIWWEKKSLWKLFLRRRSVKKKVLNALLKEMELDKDLIRKKYEQVTRLNVELEQKVAYLMSLQEASQALVSILDEQSLIQTIMSLLVSVIGFDRAILFLVDDKQKNLRFAQAVGAVDQLADHLMGYEIPLDRMSNILVRVAASGSPKFVSDVESSRLRKGNIILSLFQPRNFAAAPLIARNKVIGVLAGEMPEHSAKMTESDLNLLMTFSNQIAIAIENARLYRDLERTYLASLQAQKMEAIGNLAGGVAHDFNNILQAIVGHVGLLLYDAEASEPYYSKLKQIESSAHRAGDLVRQLLTFSRKDKSQLRPLNLNSEIREVKELLSSTIPKMIAVELQLDSDLEMINADSVQINQILVNLAVNARDAMIDSGTLVIGTKNVVLDQEFCQLNSGLQPGRHVMLWVSDTGHGVEEDVLDHMFEPFYTTKGVGKGTGLGLSTVYGIVKSHQGHVTCESKLGKGTTFKLYFPVLSQVGQKRFPEDNEQYSYIRPGSETILVVDDEAAVRKFCRELLRGFGYTVITAGSGEEALKTFLRQRGRIDLVVLDLIMEGMGGKRCLEEMFKIDPAAKIILMTGYAVEDDVAQALEKGARGLLNKPFRAEEIGKMIRRVLDEKPISTRTTWRTKSPGLRVISSK